jgi:hypothetical protein
MALGTTAHPVDVLDRLNCHEIFRFWRGLKKLKGRMRRQFGGYCGMLENDNSGIVGSAMFFSIPEWSKARIPRCHLLAEGAAGTRDAGLTIPASYWMMEINGR